MHTRPIPGTGEELPVVGLGTWQGFDVGTGADSRDPLKEVLGLLFDAGGSIIDSLLMYGRAEAVVGDLLADRGARDNAFIATKVWTDGRKRGISQMTESMRKLGCERIDLMQIHNLVDWRTHLETLRDWKGEGRIRYIGVTHYTPSAFSSLAAVIEEEKIDFVQLPYSLAVRDAEDHLLPLAADRGVAVMVNRPYDGGAMFRRVRGRAFPDWAAELDCSGWAALFLKFVLSHPAVTCVIPGTGRPEHMRDSLSAGTNSPPDSVLRDRIGKLWEEI